MPNAILDLDEMSALVDAKFLDLVAPEYLGSPPKSYNRSARRFAKSFAGSKFFRDEAGMGPLLDFLTSWYGVARD